MARQGIRARRESITGLDTPDGRMSLRELARRTGWREGSRTGINPGRLSIIERGVEPTFEEFTAIEAALADAEREKEGLSA